MGRGGGSGRGRSWFGFRPGACRPPRQPPPLTYPAPNPLRPILAQTPPFSPAGRLVIELYEDLHPIGASHLRNRCLPGATASLSGAAFHKLLRHYAAFVGKRCGGGEGCGAGGPGRG
jgi:hypothetical protein